MLECRAELFFLKILDLTMDLHESNTFQKVTDKLRFRIRFNLKSSKLRRCNRQSFDFFFEMPGKIKKGSVLFDWDKML